MNLETLELILFLQVVGIIAIIIWGLYMQDKDTSARRSKLKADYDKLKADYDKLEAKSKKKEGEARRFEKLQSICSRRSSEQLEELEDKLKEADSELHCLRRLPSDYAYPVAYWGSRKAFCTGHDGAIDCEELKDPFKSFTRYMEKFSLVEKLWNRELENHSTVKMSTGQYITFHDARIFIGDDIGLMDNDDGTPPGPPQWLWTEGGWVKEDE